MKMQGVILSGGKSSRMGTDKGLLPYKGKAMVEYAIDVLRSVCSEMVISSNDNTYKKFGLPIIADSIKNIGPIGGILSVMEAVPAKKYFIISCDLPLASRDLANLLVVNMGRDEVIVPRHSGGKVEPLFAIYSYSVLDKIKKQVEKKNYKLMNLLDECDTYYLDVPETILEGSPDLFKNINSLKDID